MKRRLRSALLALACLVALFSGEASAHFPPVPDPATDKWFTMGSGPTCTGTGPKGGPCEPSFATPFEACDATGAQVLWALTNIVVLGPFGDAPNRAAACLYSWGDCRAPSTCNAGWNAFESGDLICPPNSTLIAPGVCHCTSGFIEPDGSCSAGKNNGAPDRCCGNPANIANGGKFEQQSVYSGLNGFAFALAFNTFDDYPTRFGRRWRDSFDRRISVNGSNAFAYRPDGKAFQFVSGGGGWVPDADTNDRLTEFRDPAGTRTGWQLAVAGDDELETYDAAGRLLSIRSRVGLTQALSYSDGTNGPDGGFLLDASGLPTTVALPAGLLIRAADNFGRTLAFGYGMALRVVKLTDPAGGVYQFAYGANNNLASIVFPDNATRTYVYNEPANTGGVNLFTALTGIVDENGARFATFQYDAQERVVATEHAGGAQRYTLTYGASGTTVTDPLGATRSYGFQLTLGAFKNTGVSGPACPACGPAGQSFDANGNVSSRADWNGNVTNYSYDLARNLETSRTEAFGTPQARTVSTLWHATLRLPVRIAEPLRIASCVYNGDGVSCGLSADGATLVPGVLCSKTIQPTTDASGAAGFGAAAAGAPRTWSYTYNANGSVLTMDGPRTDVADVTSYVYYANNDADPGRRGNVATIANALGHVTSITAYNAHGQPLVIVDPNGLSTTLSYDSRQRLTSRNVGGEITGYSYDGVGQLVRVTLPDGSFLAYGYDAAHRLTVIADNLGNRIAYALDAMGNRTQEQVFDPVNNLAQTHATANAYDALNRLVRVTDPGNGQTQYAYDGIDQLVAVTDPRNLTTAYNYDGLANLNAQRSPDTGTTANTYDSAGNLLTQTDAKGQTTSYTYDALNRVTSITFADGSKHSYGYDQGANGAGRLTFIAEANSLNVVTDLIDYAYEPHGRTLTENRTINGVTYTTRYGYDAAGRLSGLTYPSGRTLAYDFDALGRVSQMSTTPPPATGGATQIVASGITYQPFGGVKSYTLGNGQSYTRGYDQDGRIASYGFGNQLFSLGYDAAGRIVSIGDAATPANSTSYGYDSLDRLTGAATPGTPFAYSYDTVGNRLTKSAGAATESYTYAAASNRLASIAGGASRSFSFDADGSTTSDGAKQYAYDARGRMVQSAGPLGTTAYRVNALGQRVRKSNSTDDRVFLYDTRGRLIAESAPSGQPLREYLYLNDIPVAVIQ